MIDLNGLSKVRSHQLDGSALHSPVCGDERPLIKVKQRSVIPTVYSLLVSDSECEKTMQIYDNGLVGNGMGTEPKNYKIPEQSNEEENDKTFIDGNSHNTLVMLTLSRRTEDIYIREDENGHRSHLCPLDKSLDGKQEIKEDSLDYPVGLDSDSDFILKGCTIASDEIPYLVAEKPPESDSDDNTDSSGTNESPTTSASEEEGAKSKVTYVQFFPQRNTVERKLSKTTMTSWTEEDSDNWEYEKGEIEAKLHLDETTAGNNSDMEEFEERKECEKEHQESDLPQNEEVIMDKKQTTDDNDNSFDENNHSLEGDDETLPTQNCSDMEEFEKRKECEKERQESDLSENGEVTMDEKQIIDDNDHSCDENNHSLEEEENLPTQNYQDNEIHETSTEFFVTEFRNSLYSENIDTDNLNENVAANDNETRNSELLDEKQATLFEDKSMAMNNDSIKQEDLKDEILRNKMLDKVNQLLYIDADNKVNLEEQSNIATDKPEDISMKSENINLLNETQQIITDIKDKEIEESKNSLIKQKINEAITEVYSLELSPHTYASVEELKMEKKEKLNMEPFPSETASMNKERYPDLSTALRFMTEVYHTKDDELYSYTGSSDLTIELLEKEVLSSDVSNENNEMRSRVDSADKPLSVTPEVMSGPFQPNLQEEQKDEPQPRNKLTKFFKSFKRKFTKKA